MKISLFLNLFVLFIYYITSKYCVVNADTVTYTCNCTLPFDRTEFPPGFSFGAGSASYQVEGAWNISGKGPSIWDSYTHSHPERITDHSNGDIATNAYYQYPDDIRAAKRMNLDTYRISLSWSRLLPNGKLSGGINPDGVRFYNDVIDEMIAQGIEPCVTIFHWDVPQYLEDLYLSFLSPKIVEDYANYANLAFKLFGDRVKTWITFNEPNIFSEHGYAQGLFAPGRCSFWYDDSCLAGNAGTEPYIVGHHMLLAHAATVRLYRTTYQTIQNGSIGITLAGHWILPFNPNKSDDAPLVALDFQFGWFMNPITFGDYPINMIKRLGDRLPRFTKQQKKLLIKSYDFLGLNYYTGQFAHYFPNSYKPPYPSYETDGRVNLTMTDINGNYLGGGPEYDHIWIQLYPLGLFQLLQHIKDEYHNPTILITENGMCTNGSMPQYTTINDTERITYIDEHVCCVQNAIANGSNVVGMILWSLTDNFEWHSGYTVDYGLYFIDRKNGYQRIPKYSALWLAARLSKDYVRETPIPTFPPISNTPPSRSNFRSKYEPKPEYEENHIILHVNDTVIDPKMDQVLNDN